MQKRTARMQLTGDADCSEESVPSATDAVMMTELPEYAQ